MITDKVHDEEEKIRDPHERPERSIAPWMYDRSTSQVKDAMEAIQVKIMQNIVSIIK